MNRMLTGCMMALAVLLLAGTAGAQDTYLWTNTGGDNSAATGANWTNVTAGGVGVPTSTDFVHLDPDHASGAGSAASMNWSETASDTVAGWTQTTAYTGTVTIETRFPGQGDFQVLTITGDCLIEGGVWTHLNDNHSSSPDWPEYSRLNVKIEGQLTLGASAVIDVDGRGYQNDQGPGRGADRYNRGASHGGQGGFRTTVAPVAPYGSLFDPIRLGSGSQFSRGGGAVRLVVDQATLLQGEIRARAGTTTDSAAAGGSVFLTTQTLSGDGLIDVSGGNGARTDRGDGAGGRIAVILTSGTSFGNVRMQAHGGNFGYRAAAGTVYRQTATQQTGEGSLIVDNNNGSAWPALTIPAEAVNLDALAELMVTNNGHFVVDAKVTVTFGTAHIHGGGEVRVRDTNNVSFPSPFNLAPGYTLCLDTPVTASGNWTIASNAVLSHTFSEYLHSVLPDNAIDLTIHGDLTVANGGRISAYGRGYSASGPGGRGGNHTGGAGTHGGRGGYNPSSQSPTPTYGSIRAPVLSGSGGAGRAGGAIKLDVRGSLTVEGNIDASGLYSVSGIGGSGSGGSIYIMADAMTGDGQLNAKGGESLKSDSVSSGGGRISVVLRNGTDFGSVAMIAVGGKEGTAAYAKGAAGTIYRQTGNLEDGAGTVSIDNTGVTTTLDVVTVLPPDLFAVEDELVAAALALQTNARLQVRTNLMFRALSIDSSAILNLAGHTVTLKESFEIGGVVYGHGQYAATDLPDQVVDTEGVGGRVILLPPPPRGTLLVLR